ncbi:hypothetical protein LPJ64_004718 [Coemansia asiatica]|uniref:HMG box domain-containing protein n=1 Tax=Coemansia asiatica TaxID=1052880 RepID=A0A9W7XIL8_9FUNG|nr:hypothetical protein LPJ64_004718 [Coemansia asiatica]
MADFNYMYANQAFGGNQMSSMGYAGSIMGAPTGAEQQMAMFGAYGNTGHMAKSMPSQPAAPGTQTFSSQVLSDSSSFVYCFDEASGTHSEHNVRQMVASDMSVFIEHMPGYHLVFIPVGCNVNMATREMMGGHSFSMAGNSHGGSRKGSNGKGNGAKAHAVVEKTSKPSNAFIMYRNHKIEELRQQMPDINQIEISREAGKWWRAESDEVKKHFQDKYREEKLAYDLKKSKRSRADSSAGLSDDLTADGETMAPKKKKSKTSRNSNSFSLGLSSGSGGAKPRSQTMPSNMFNSSNARLGIMTDLRKQMAARNSSVSSASISGGMYLDGSTPQESPHLYHSYADLSSSSALGQQNSMVSMQTLVSSQDAPSFIGGGSSVHMFPSGSSYTAVDSDGSDPSGMADQSAAMAAAAAAAAHMGDSSDLASSLVSAGLPVSIHMSHEDLAAAASMAASAAMAGNSFYTADVTHDNDGSQWGTQSVPSFGGINPADTHNGSAAETNESAAALVQAALTSVVDSSS